ncbi:20850_t:CDS:2, partial [Dentiscutata erythropus]
IRKNNIMENEQDLPLSFANNSETKTAPLISTMLSASSANSLVQKKQRPIHNTSPWYDQVKITDYSKVAPPCSPKRQELITLALVSFIIKFVQPLYILQNSKEQLRLLLNNIYGQQCEDGDEEESNSLASDNNEISSGGS